MIIHSTLPPRKPPPSVHLSGNHYEWEAELRPVKQLPMAPEWLVELPRRQHQTRRNGHREITITQPVNLDLGAVKRAALEHWTDGQRHDLALALAGALRKSAVPLQDAEKLIGEICVRAGDAEVVDRLRAVADTYAKPLEDIAGFSRLPETLQKLFQVDDKPAGGILQQVAELLTQTGRNKLSPQEKDAVLERTFQELVQLGRLFRDAETAEPYLLYGRQLGHLDEDDLITQMAMHRWMFLNPATEVYRQVVADIQLRARQEAPTIHIAHWQEYRDGKLYISCGPEHLVRVNATGIHKLPNGTDDVWFAADSCYPEWTPTTPVAPLSLHPFRPSLQAPPEAPRYTPEDQYRLALAWMIARVAAFDQLPLLVNRGGRGSGKSEWAKAVVRTFHPKDTVQDTPTDQRDFNAKLVHDAIIALDNIDEDVPGWLKDAIARTVTGTRIRQRKLYTNYGIAEAEPRAGIIVTSRTAVWARADVAERAVILCAAPMEGRRTDDETLRREVAQHRDGILTYLALHAWKVRQMTDQAPDLPGRFVNFSRCAWAYGQLVGWNAARALKANGTMQSVIAADSDLLVSALVEAVRELMQAGRVRRIVEDGKPPRYEFLQRDDLADFGVPIIPPDEFLRTRRRGERERCVVKELYDVYTRYCYLRGGRPEPLREFLRALRCVATVTRVSKRSVEYSRVEGISLKEERVSLKRTE